MENFIFGLRPVIEAIKAGREIDRILIKKDAAGRNIGELLDLIKENGIVSRRVPVEKLNKITGKNHQGVVAYLSAVPYHRLDNLVPELFEKGIVPFVVILDGITDVRNFGAIARTCECAGIDAIVIPERGSVSVGADAVKTSAGALLTVPVCREPNLSSAVKDLRNSGFEVVAASEKATDNYTAVDYTVPVAIVMGNEETGIDTKVLRNCTSLVRIPQFGMIQSLNVSVAAGVMMYEVVRQRIAEGMTVE